MKELIKELSEQQKNLKKARKTGTLPEIERDYFGYPIHSKLPPAIKDAWMAASRVRVNKPTITAALNLYHEMRGSDYRHGVPEEYKYEYNREIERLRAEYIDKKA